jgi:hypothetical protein
MVNGYAAWTETDAYSMTGDSAGLQWSDPFFGVFSELLGYSGAPAGYCPPCYKSAQSVDNAQITVQALTGSCPADTSINSGNPVTYDATGVTLTPQ